MTITLPDTEVLRDDLEKTRSEMYGVNAGFPESRVWKTAEAMLTLLEKIGPEMVRGLIEGNAWYAPMEPTCDMRFSGHAHILHENQQSEFSIHKPDVQNFCAGLFRAMRDAHRKETT